jgi:hypothetical protein
MQAIRVICKSSLNIEKNFNLQIIQFLFSCKQKQNHQCVNFKNNLLENYENLYKNEQKRRLQFELLFSNIRI